MKLFFKIFFSRIIYNKLRWIFSRFGIKILLKFLYFEFFLKQKYFLVSNNFDNRGIFIRVGTTDMDVFDEYFLNYEFTLKYNNVKVIIDAGAHIGISAINFALLYPDALIIAIEAEKSNFEVLQLNSTIYKNIIPINAPLLGTNVLTEINTINNDNWAYSVSLSNDKFKGVNSITINDIITKFNIQNIDILKIDIEGSEIEVLNNSDLWSNILKNMIIELHERFRPGCLQSLNHFLINKSFINFSIGEKQVYSFYK